MAEAAVQKTEYETIYILKPDTPRETTESVAGRLADIIKVGGRMTRVENWGRRKLAYEVARQKRGVYVYLKYLGGGATVSEVERALRLQESVLKFHTVRLGLSDVEAEVNEDEVRFEHVEQLEEDEEQSLAEELGLLNPPRRSSYNDSRDDDDDDDDDSSEDDE